MASNEYSRAWSYLKSQLTKKKEEKRNNSNNNKSNEMLFL